MNPLDSEVICGAVAAACVCSLPPNHAGEVHECHRHGCGGKWSGEIGTDTFRVVRLPGALTRARKTR
jgi:hypothetical protein